VLAFTLAISEPSDREQIGRVEETHAVLEVQTNAGVQLLCDVSQACSAEAGKHQWG